MRRLLSRPGVVWCALAIALLNVVTACGHTTGAPQGPRAATVARCPTPVYPSPGPVVAHIDPVPTPDPAHPYDSTFTLRVPAATELLVADIDTNAASKNDFTPTFVSPDGTSLSRAQFTRDSFFNGNPYYGGIAELVWIQSPKAGGWELVLHDAIGKQMAVNLRVNATFHLHFPPLVSIAASPTSGPVPLTVAFDAGATQVDGGSATYCWDFGDGTIAKGEKVSHTFREGGTYYVGITATDATGDPGFGRVEITATD